MSYSEYLKCLGSHNLLDLYGFQQIHVQKEVMAVTLMLFVRLLKALTSAHVKQALKEMGNTVKVKCLFSVQLFVSHSTGYQPFKCQAEITEF